MSIFYQAGKRRERAFKTGDVAGVLEILDPGDPAAFSQKRKCSVRCTKCKYKSVVLEAWLRWIRDGRVPYTGTCSMCSAGHFKRRNERNS